MDNRHLKKEIYLEQLNQAIISVEMVFNQLNRLSNNNDINQQYIVKDLMRTRFQLELSLASLCIILRKMNENAFLQLHPERRKDINSIIHSNKFEFNDVHYIYVY